jgi:hypothetical protein
MVRHERRLAQLQQLAAIFRVHSDVAEADAQRTAQASVLAHRTTRSREDTVSQAVDQWRAVLGNPAFDPAHSLIWSAHLNGCVTALVDARAAQRDAEVKDDDARHAWAKALARQDLAADQFSSARKAQRLKREEKRVSEQADRATQRLVRS